MNYFSLQSSGILTPEIYLALISGLFVLTTIFHYRYFCKTGNMYEHYPLSMSVLFAPLYEEVIFRGLILDGLMQMYAMSAAVIVSSLLFGL